MAPMRTLLRSFALLAALSPALPVVAQTYTPKTIRIEGATGMDTDQLLGIANLKPGTLSKEQIEGALQRLGDTGMFTDLSYTVSSEALVFKVTAPATSRSLPVRYANFVWWRPEELEKLVEARVPIFQGKLPFSGTLTEQVEAALTALLGEKGIDAKVEAVQSTDVAGGPVTGVALTITRPEILVGQTHVEGASPAFTAKLDVMGRSIAGQDFGIEETSRTIRQRLSDIYEDAGYLDVANDPPSFAPPRKDMDRFLIDATVVVHPGEMYRITQIDLPAVPPVSAAELAKAAGIKTGDPAGAAALRLAKGELAKAYQDRGYLDAFATEETNKDSAAHTVVYSFHFTPGEVYHLAGVDATALPPDVQKTFANDPELRPGVVASAEMKQEVFQILHEKNLLQSVKVQMDTDSAQRTLKVVLGVKR